MSKRDRARVIALEAKLRGQALEQVRVRCAKEGIHGRTAANAWGWRPSHYAGMGETVADARDRFRGTQIPGKPMTMREIRRLGQGLPDLVCLAAAAEAYLGVGQWVEEAPFASLDVARPEWRPMIDSLIARSRLQRIVWWPRPTGGAEGVAYLSRREIGSLLPLDIEGLRVFVHECGHLILGHGEGAGSFDRAMKEVEAETFVIDTFTAHGLVATDRSREYIEGQLEETRFLWMRSWNGEEDWKAGIWAQALEENESFDRQADLIESAYLEHEERERNQAGQGTLC